MTTTFDQTTSAQRAITLPAFAMLSALALFALLQVMAFKLTGGAFEYALDDPYIHLAIAENIARGGYGVNAQELSSPGSSALFPILLIPFHGTEFHRFLPLIWNIVGLSLTAYLWGRLLFEAGYARPGWRWLGVTAALVGPFALMMPLVAFVGMEHTLHAAAAMAVLLGLHRHLENLGGTALILAGAFFGSALRLEGVALGGLAAVALFFTGKRGAGVATLVAALLPIVLFVGFLMSLGLDPLPSSVQAKMEMGATEAPGALASRLGAFAHNLSQRPGLLVTLLAMAILIVWRTSPTLKDSRWSAFAAVVILAALAHLFAGQIGWLNRYEHYVLVLTAGGLLALLPKAVEGAPRAMSIAATALVLIGGIVAYQNPVYYTRLPVTARAIYNQQAQMAIFAKDYLKTDVAVNDLGWVAWQNPNYVLDLWGLASAKARVIRLSNPEPGWTGMLAETYDVPAAMVYDHWFGEGLGIEWIKIGVLSMTANGGFLGGADVAFYATKPEHVQMMQEAVSAWVPTLSDHAKWTWAEGMEP